MMRARSVRPLLLLSLPMGPLLLVGCMSHTRGDETDAGPPALDAAPIGRDGCACVDGGPPTDAWVDPSCEPQDARGVGGCEAELGYVWRGDSCWSISGCSCEGEDCGALAATAEACLAEHARCDRSCGGFAEVGGCFETEYCDYPDGSFCGGDDSTGVCRPRPTECLDPGGVPACGCDGVDYVFDCNAYLAGTDIRSYGPCVTTHAYDTAKADRYCAPTDGPAWTITLTTSRETCADEPLDGSIELSVWHALERASPETVYELGRDFAGDGQARVCGSTDAPCDVAEGTIVFHVFAPGEVARFDFDIRTEDGRRFAETNVEIARFWCRLEGPGCG
ncbi:MAG: hypothetical protein J0L92_07880 [Deltaproteobacteria bacterium]|nr:hypothetical protein [Deltaproteobacteria bacterium]